MSVYLSLRQKRFAADLLAKIRNRGPMQSIDDVVFRWFVENVYEYEVSQVISGLAIVQLGKDLEEYQSHMIRKASLDIAEAFVKKGAVKTKSRSHLAPGGGIELITSAIVMFRPDFTEDNETGKMSYLGGEGPL